MHALRVEEVAAREQLRLAAPLVEVLEADRAPRAVADRPGGGGAYDADTGYLYVKTSNVAAVMTLAKFDPASTSNPFADTNEPDYVGYDTARGGRPTFEGSLPLNKPPYAFLVAIDLNTGDLAWRVPFGRGSERLRTHPGLEGVDLPDRLGTPGAPGAIVTNGGLVFAGGGEDALYAFDKRSGREVWSNAALIPSM